MEERINPENEVLVQSEPAELLAEEREEIREAAQPAAAGKSNALRTTFNILCNGAFALLLLTMVFLVFTMVQSRLIGGPPSVAGYQMYIVQGGSMSPAFEAGSLAFLKPVQSQNIAIGDIITYRSAGGGDTLTTHRVMEVNRDGGSLSFTTRGDANLVNDSLPVYPENIVGRIVYAVPYAGYLMNFGQSKTGIMALVFIPGAFIIAFELRNLFRIAAEWEAQKKNTEKTKKDSLPEEV